jgi:hypothetical protein
MATVHRLAARFLARKRSLNSRLTSSAISDHTVRGSEQRSTISGRAIPALMP